jgi:hypothetical protein
MKQTMKEQWVKLAVSTKLPCPVGHGWTWMTVEGEPSADGCWMEHSHAVSIAEQIEAIRPDVKTEIYPIFG